MTQGIEKLTSINDNPPITFLGISDNVQYFGQQPFPIGSIDLFQLSKHKWHLFFPTISSGYRWIFCLNVTAIDESTLATLKIRVGHEDGELHGDLKVMGAEKTPSGNDIDEIKKKAKHQKQEKKSLLPHTLEQQHSVFFPNDTKSKVMLLCVEFEGPIWRPGKYVVTAELLNQAYELGEVYFYYTPVPKLTTDQVKALKSNPRAAKILKMYISCKTCKSDIFAYTALEKNKKLEKKERYIWQDDLPDHFVCSCGLNNRPLKYMRENMHALLLDDYSGSINGISYVRQYAHTNIANIAQQFETLLAKEESEEPIQKFIEKNPILLAQFHAKRIFHKPRILGKYVSDFAILDGSNKLWLIEIERPTMELFKSNGHMTAHHLHAYEQIRDWMHEYGKHPSAVLEGLNLTPDSVIAVKGALIAGRSQNEDVNFLRKHLSDPPYPDIAFYTLDDLSRSLFEISVSLS